ncbi:MAG: hypothetical protein IRZ02_09810, partial [Acidothermus sp.]|nr:hypothetical protein [Acidothermus sp.]
ALTGGPPVPGTSVATLAPATPPGLVDVLDRWLTLPPERLRPDGLAAELLRAYPAAPIQLGTAATTAGGPSPAGPPPPSKARSPGEAGEEEAVASSQAAVTRRPDVRRFVWPAAVGFAAVAVAAVSVGGLLGWSLPGGRPAQADRPLAAWQSSQVPSSGGRVVAILPSESGVPSPLSAAAGPTPPDGRAQAAASTIAWRDVLDRLYALRARAFTDLDADALARVYVPGSALRAADEATIRALQASGSRPEGLGWRLESVQVRAERPAAVTLFVVDQRRAYSVVGPDGTRTTYPAQTSSRTIDLRLVDGEWRIEAIGSP